MQADTLGAVLDNPRQSIRYSRIGITVVIWWVGDCQGDSGGPLFKKLPVDEENGNETGRFFQFGLVSTGAVVECIKKLLNTE